MTAANIATLFGIMFVLSITPGPSDFAIVARSMALGFKQGLIMTCGIIASDFVFILFAIYSLSEVAESMSALFVVVKYVCAAYLIWIGIGSLRAKPKAIDPKATKGKTNRTERTSSSSYASFVSGFLITLGDPGAILFYMGLLPTFVDLRTISWQETFTIMMLSATVISIVKLSEAYLVDKATKLFNNSKIRRRLNVVSGCVLIGTGIVLIIR